MMVVHSRKDSVPGRVTVTYSTPSVAACDSLYLVGWFDASGESVYRMERTSGGGWSLTLELELGMEGRYCFRTTGGDWVHDPCARDAFVPGPPNTA